MRFLELFSTKRSCRLLVNLEGEIVAKYKYFKEFLNYNYQALNLLAELEQTYYTGSPFSMGLIEKQGRELLACTRHLVQALDGLGRGRYGDLLGVLDGLERELAPLYYPAPYCLTGELVLPLAALTSESFQDAGGKATHLAALGNLLALPIPPGFVVTACAFGRFLEENGLIPVIEETLAGLSPEAYPDLEAKSRGLQEMILRAPVPEVLAAKILEAYAALEAQTWKNVRIAMRSSAVGEDSQASFAGQYLTCLNVTREGILEAYKKVVASKYSPRAILYRLRYGLDDRDTPMCVAGVVMVDSRASGVLYTVDPGQADAGLLKISSIWGLGEHLVSGEAAPDEFYVDRETLTVRERLIGRKEHRQVNLPGGGLQLEEVPEAEKGQPSLQDDQVKILAQAGLRLEEHFGAPQDVEWAIDGQGKLFFLQSRLLGLIQGKPSRAAAPPEFPGHPIRLAAGRTASPGVVSGTVFLAREQYPGPLPEAAILVAKTASPEHAGLMGRIRGIITDVGSVTSHLASVAREFGLPAIFAAGNATAVLADGEVITLVADTATVYQGLVPELTAAARPTRKHIADSPMHRRLRAVLDRLSPLNLTDPQSPAFAPAGCRTLHDIIRFSHERSMQEMFGLAAAGKGEVVSCKLTTHIPLSLYLIDLGGGIKSGLTTCHEIIAEHLESVPMRALWRGLAHPGISWSGGIPFAARDLLRLMAQGAMAGEGDLPGGDSFAVLSREYVNLSAKFGYHYANLDAFVGVNPEENYFSLQFAGGAGGQYGRSLRLNFLGQVLGRLGCKLKVTADLLEASTIGHDLKSMEATLEQVGRLLAASRLLDMAITREGDVGRMVEAFFQGDYDFFHMSQERALPGFYTPVGEWQRLQEEERYLIFQDGSSFGRGLSSGLASLMGKMMGAKYQEFLDNIEAYYYFPLAIAKESSVGDARLSVRTRCAAGKIDQAGGLAFAIRDVANYFVLRINALEDNFTLFEYVNNKRWQRANIQHPINTGQWYRITAAIAGNTLKSYLDGELLLEYQAPRQLEGFVGLWTKADSVTYFDDLVVEVGGKVRRLDVG
ncbi:MAG TPA: PEP/pyruvate-binding domain-containing protein [Desulfobaccales bacterium]